MSRIRATVRAARRWALSPVPGGAPRSGRTALCCVASTAAWPFLQGGSEIKKFGIVLCAMLVVFGSMAGVAHAAPSYNQMWNEYCKWLADVDPDWFDYFYKNHGDCVRDYTARYPNSDAAKFCQEMWDDPWFQMYYSWKNQGDCVSYWQKYFK